MPGTNLIALRAHLIIACTFWSQKIYRFALLLDIFVQPFPDSWIVEQHYREKETVSEWV